MTVPGYVSTLMNEARDALIALQINGNKVDTMEATALLRKANQRVQLVADELDLSFTDALTKVRGY
jgi:hypothetical protein